MCVRQNLCLYLCVRARCMHVCVDRDTPGGGGSVPSVTVTCFIVTHRGGGFSQKHPCHP